MPRSRRTYRGTTIPDLSLDPYELAQWLQTTAETCTRYAAESAADPEETPDAPIAWRIVGDELTTCIQRISDRFGEANLPVEE